MGRLAVEKKLSFKDHRTKKEDPKKVDRKEKDNESGKHECFDGLATKSNSQQRLATRRRKKNTRLANMRRHRYIRVLQRDIPYDDFTVRCCRCSFFYIYIY